MSDVFDKYRDFSVSQFVLDEDFANWVKKPNEEQDKYWTSFLKYYPGQVKTIEQAKLIISNLQPERETVDDQVRDRVWTSIQAKASPSPRVLSMNRRRWLTAAAAVLVLVSGAIFLKLGAVKNEVIQTAYGEQKTITLPDNSTVVLNAASRIEYKNDWPAGSPREVWVEGEAFFDVAHKHSTGAEVKPSDRFIVHLKHMKVEVLGTRFTINTRRSGEQVVLETGSIKVNLNNQEEFYLKPGEMVQYDQTSKTIARENINARDHVLWKDNRLKFENSPLSEIIQLIEDNYGYQVVLQDSSLLHRTISGTLSSENEEVLFKALESMLDLKISISGKKATISKK